MEQWNKYYTISKIFDGNRYMIVATNNGFAGTKGFLILNKNEPSDRFSTVGPDGEPRLFLGGIAFNPMSVHDNRLVGYVQAFDIVDNAAAITNPDLKALAATLKEDDNPVIVVAILKK
jgi:hypothetical protein